MDLEKYSPEPLQPQILDDSTSKFVSDILRGLKSTPKYLQSKYFYDHIGDALFQQIMHLDEYYLTRAEMEIIEAEKNNILDFFISERPFRLIELGAGDGLKTKVLLKHFYESKASFEYIPIDISKNVIESLIKELWAEFDKLSIFPLVGDYFDILSELKTDHLARKVVLFLGSNIGNFDSKETTQFLSHLSEVLNPKDLLFIGFDLKKNPHTIHRAYNDINGITESFNFNMLDRINKTLNGDFIRDKFIHYPTYDPQNGECRSYLVSKEDQVVNLSLINEQITFKAWECIHMETSKKYNEEEIVSLAHRANFYPIAYFYDSNHLFLDTIWERMSDER